MVLSLSSIVLNYYIMNVIKEIRIMVDHMYSPDWPKSKTATINHINKIESFR